ncbi:hypothetical protein [Mycoavidus cysteinexigens]|nr:hypothetical protein [Mycoavidus cysteinexigens]
MEQVTYLLSLETFLLANKTGVLADHQRYIVEELMTQFYGKLLEELIC